MSLIKEIKTIESGTKQLKDFGRVMAVAFLIFAIIGFAKHKVVRADLLVISLLFGILSCFALGRKVLLPLQKVWMAFACVMGFIMSRILLSALYFIILTPIALIGKMLKKEFLEERIDKNRDSYWIKRTTSYAKEQTETMF